MRPPEPAIILWVCLATGLSAGAEPPRLRVDAPVTVVSGTLVGTSVSLEVTEGEVLGWSVSVFLEGLSATEIWTAGTDFERLSAGGYSEAHIGEAGAAFGAVGVLSFAESVALPAGSSTVLGTTCRVTRKEPGDARILPRDGFEPPSGGDPLRNQAVVAGGAVIAVTTSEGLVPVRGCAAYALALEGALGESPPARVRVPRGGRLVLQGAIQVPSPLHLEPTGFSLGLRHDPAILRLEGVELVPELVDSWVRPDGTKTVTLDATGFEAIVRSSASEPVALGPGKHAALRAAYRLEADASPGEVLRTRFDYRTEPPEAGGPAPTAFQPSDAQPCDATGLAVEIEVAIDPWLRGDVNGDGFVNIADAISLLGHLFLGQTASCVRAMEINLDGHEDLSDAVHLLNYLFFGGAEPAAPFPGCDSVPSDDPCEVSGCAIR